MTVDGLVDARAPQLINGIQELLADEEGREMLYMYSGLWSPFVTTGRLTFLTTRAFMHIYILAIQWSQIELAWNASLLLYRRCV
jgi:hypothetical protein